MDRRGNHVVARLAHVDVIIGMNEFARPDRFASELGATIRDHFVRVGVCART